MEFKENFMEKINIIGGGLAGSEAALYLAERGYKINLYEMRPKKTDRRAYNG